MSDVVDRCAMFSMAKLEDLMFCVYLWSTSPTCWIYWFDLVADVLSALRSNLSSHCDAFFQPIYESPSAPGFGCMEWCCLANLDPASDLPFACAGEYGDVVTLEVLNHGQNLRSTQEIGRPTMLAWWQSRVVGEYAARKRICKTVPSRECRRGPGDAPVGVGKGISLPRSGCFCIVDI